MTHRVEYLDDDKQRAAAPWMDVWSRSGSAYRVRSFLLLSINVVLFAGVSAFAFWLRTGWWFAPLMPSYGDEVARTFRFTGTMGVTLGSLLMRPINVLDVPMQIPIVGLLIAALISIPILIAILYRFWASIPFIVVVGWLAVMPWLAITLLLSCLIASVRPFRTKIRFVSALAGLIPAVVYLFLAWGGSSDLIAETVEPVDRIKFLAPWVLAIVAAAALFALVLSIARIVDYRPGAVTPLLAVMFGLPVALFEFHVGRDELYYRLLEARNEVYFADVDASSNLTASARRKWERLPPPRQSWQAAREMEEQKWLFEVASDLQPYQSELTRHQATIVDQCDSFLLYFPKSRYATNALFFKARALDMRVDLLEFRRSNWIRFYSDFPSNASRGTWTLIQANARPGSGASIVAALRLAQIGARQGHIERTISRLREIQKLAESLPPGGHDRAGTLTAVLERRVPEDELPIDIEQVLLDARRLYDLLTNNRDSIYGYEPISGPSGRRDAFRFGLLDIDPRGLRYAENLAALAAHYPHAEIQDNVALEIAKTATTTENRITALTAYLERYPKGDAAAETLFLLGIAYREGGQADRSVAVLDQLAKRFPESHWLNHSIRYDMLSAMVHNARTRD